MSARLDPVALAQALIRCPSVTPKDEGALDLLQKTLESLGFACRRLPFGEDAGRVDNLFAKIGAGRPHLMFAGHTDVVPPGDAARWRRDPFAGEIVDGILTGRGAADMKSAIAAFAAAAARYLAEHPLKGALSFLITGDEEGDAVNGTKKVLERLTADGEIVDHALVGEPSSQEALGDTIKIGRRGSMTVKLAVAGKQGHVAYPERADNPVHRLLPILAKLAARRLDEGTEFFSPSSLQVTTVDVGNPATNVIPPEVSATFNIRFNDLHTSQSLLAWIDEELKAVGAGVTRHVHVSGEAFRTAPGPWTELVGEAIRARTGRAPAFSTGGGTSDARFIKDYCPVVEFGLAGTTMHQIDESVPVADIMALADVYSTIIARYFETFA